MKIQGLYHGSQNNNLKLTNKPLYLVNYYEVAEDFALGYNFNYDLYKTDKPTVYEIDIEIKKVILYT